MLPLLLKPTGSTGFTTGTGYCSPIGRYAAGLGTGYASNTGYRSITDAFETKPQHLVPLSRLSQADFPKVRRVPGNRSEALCWAEIAIWGDDLENT